MRVRLYSQMRKNFLRASFKKFSSIEKIFDQKKIQEYKDKGFTVLPKVFSTNYIEELKSEIDKIINNTNQNDIKSIFDAGHASTDLYFLNSGDNV